MDARETLKRKEGLQSSTDAEAGNSIISFVQKFENPSKDSQSSQRGRTDARSRGRRAAERGLLAKVDLDAGRAVLEANGLSAVARDVDLDALVHRRGGQIGRAHV